MDAGRSRASRAPTSASRFEPAYTWSALLAYVAISLVFTWPLARGLTRDVPSDLGDSLLNMWILAWNGEQLRHLFSGDVAVLTRWFDGNIFYPVPDALAYSEHLFPQALQAWPVYLLTRNPILCYNLIFLSTYALSGLGTYLLVRQLTGDRRAAFVAGLIFAFIPYRNPQSTHVQVLSSQWMPFALYGFTRYLDTGRRRALAGGAASLVLQGLSCTYYLIYFSPVAAVYAVWELARRGRLGDWRAWVDFSIAAVAGAALIAPFLIPYVRVQATTQLERHVQEIALYSADVYAYLTAFPNQRIWGSLVHMAPRAEGELFMGVVPLFLLIVGALLAIVHAWRESRVAVDRRPAVSMALLALAMGLLTVAGATTFMRRVVLDLGLFTIRVGDIGRVLLLFTLVAGVLVATSRRARAAIRASLTVEMFFLATIVACWWLSLGPFPQSMGRPIDLPAPYRLFYALPGVDGVRVPARLGMVMALMIAVVAGLVIARLPRRRASLMATAALTILFLVEAPAAEFSVNGVSGTQGHTLPEARIYPPASAPPIYRTVAALPGRAVLLELPLGDTNWDVFSVYYAAAHWRPVVNGYSGFFPAHYGRLTARLLDPERDPNAAWEAVRDSGATHLLLHERAYRQAEVQQIQKWLGDRSVREIARAGDDILYDVRR